MLCRSFPLQSCLWWKATLRKNLLIWKELNTEHKCLVVRPTAAVWLEAMNRWSWAWLGNTSVIWPSQYILRAGELVHQTKANNFRQLTLQRAHNDLTPPRLQWVHSGSLQFLCFPKPSESDRNRAVDSSCTTRNKQKIKIWPPKLLVHHNLHVFKISQNSLDLWHATSFTGTLQSKDPDKRIRAVQFFGTESGQLCQPQISRGKG